MKQGSRMVPHRSSPTPQATFLGSEIAALRHLAKHQKT
jgi:hypothetical protein